MTVRNAVPMRRLAQRGSLPGVTAHRHQECVTCGMRGNSRVPFLGGAWRQASATRLSTALPLPALETMAGIRKETDMDKDRIAQNLAAAENHFHSEALNEVETATVAASHQG